MAQTIAAKPETGEKKKSFKMPDIYVVLVGIILLMGILTWIVPAGEYAREVVETAHGTKTAVIPGSFEYVESSPVGFMDLLFSIPRGLENAAELVFMTLLAGGAIGVIRRTGIVEMGVNGLLNALGDRTQMIIPILMLSFATICGFIGVPELSIAFLPIVLPLMFRLGYDSVTATAIAILPTTLGFAFGITIPGTVGIGQAVGELPLFSGAWLRALTLLGCVVVCSIYTMRHAAKVKASPQLSPMFKQDIETRAELAAEEEETVTEYTFRHKLAGFATIGMFAAIIWAILSLGLSYSQMGALFMGMAVVTSLLVGDSLDRICSNFNIAFKEMLVGALIVGIARAISLVMMDGNIIDTVVHGMEVAVSSLPNSLTVIGIFISQLLINFPVPSGSGQTILTMPVLVPLGDLLGITRQTLVLATQWGDGLTNLIFPTSGYFVATLAISKMSLGRWLQFYMPLFIVLCVLASIVLVMANTMGYGPF